MEVLVSIIIPCYNSSTYLADCITSALAQTVEEKEILVIDDGSTDDSLAIAKSFEQRGVAVFHQVNKGASAARNVGLKYAKGRYVQFLDADDLLHPSKIKFQLDLLAEQDNVIALCPTVQFTAQNDVSLKHVTHEWYGKEDNDPVNFLIKLYGGNLIGKSYGGAIQPNAWLTPMSIIEKAGNWNENLSLDDDGEFFCRVVLASKGVVYSPNSINYYRQFDTGINLSSGQSFKHQLSALNANRLKAEHLLKASDDTRIRLAMSRCFWENAFNFFSNSKDLSYEAETLAKYYAPNLKIQFYRNKLKSFLSGFLGWKFVKRIDQFRLQLGLVSHPSNQN